jgi:CheY-like chemotaxis protein
MDKTNKIKDVLLAEDDPDDVLIFELAIKELPFPLVLRLAENGDMLFVMINQMIPDIIFLDINMPCKDGVTCIKEIRKNESLHHVPVIMYTSLKSVEYINQCYENGANFFLIKANSIHELAEKLEKIFSVDWKSYMYYPPKNQFVMGA